MQCADPDCLTFITRIRCGYNVNIFVNKQARNIVSENQRPDLSKILTPHCPPPPQKKGQKYKSHFKKKIVINLGGEGGC